MANELYRELLDGIQFDHLIPKSKCNGASGNSGNGDTDHSISKMIQAVNNFSYQTDLLAQELQENSLPEFIASIHWFLFNHIQYLEDNEEQILRSPACSWQSRVSGIDCKSYSIFASAICRSLQIAHFIRKVNYTDVPEAYSHVYVIVPVDQEKQDLKFGYYIIDGTLKYNNEIIFIEKKDYNMTHTTLAKPNYGMNGWQDTFNDIKNSSAGQIAQSGASGGIDAAVNTALEFIPFGSTVKFLLDKLGIDISSISNLFKSLDCIGGTAYESPDAEADRKKIIAKVFEIINGINEAVLERDMVKLSKFHTLIYAGTVALVHSSQGRIQEGWNSCSTKNLTTIAILSANLHHEFFMKVVNPWFIYFFDYQKSGTVNVNQLYAGTVCGLPCSTGKQYNIPVDTYSFQIKQGITLIPALEFTPEVNLSLTTPVSFSQDNALNSLKKVIQVVKPIVVEANSGNGTNTTTNSNTGVVTPPYNGNNNQNLPPPTTKTSGYTGLIALGVGALVIYGITQGKKK